MIGMYTVINVDVDFFPFDPVLTWDIELVYLYLYMPLAIKSFFYCKSLSTL